MNDKNLNNRITYGCEHCKSECASAPKDYTILTGDKNDRLEPDENGVIWWSVANFTPDLPKYKTLFAIEQAFNIWAAAFNPITFKSTSDLDKAQIKIFFTKRDHSEQVIYTESGEAVTVACPYPFDGKGGVLAHAFAPYGGKLQGHLHLDEAEAWSDAHKSIESGIDLLTVLVHEIGHNLNAGHSEVKDAIMFPSYTGEKRSLHLDDLKLVHEIYGDLILYYQEKLYPIEEPDFEDEEEEPVIDTEEPQSDDDEQPTEEETEKTNSAGGWMVALIIIIAAFALIYYGLNAG